MKPKVSAVKSVRVLFEDDHLLVVDKPSGLRVTRPGSAPSAGVEFIAALLDTGPLQVVRPLEEHVSGAQVLAKSEQMAARLATCLNSKRAKTAYLAVVRGTLRRPSKRSRGAPLPAFPIREVQRGKELTLVACTHESSRTSQVRADLHALGLAPLGDARDSRRSSSRRPGGRLFLHRGGIVFPHPVTGKSVTVEAARPAAFRMALTGGDLIEDLLQVALNARAPCLADPQTDCWRLHVGKAEGITGLVAEKLGPVIILQTQPGKFAGDLDRVRRIGKWYARAFDASAVYHKRLAKDRSSGSAPYEDPSNAGPLIGKPAREEITIRENGLKFLVRPDDGYLTGLFLDQRDNRRRVGELAHGRRVLNTFAYTCGFSVAAAVGGATQTVSVDISTKNLEWGKRNFAANRLDPSGHLFICSEVFDYFKRSRRQKRSFDLIVLDAPTFSRSKRPAKVFSIASDLRPLIVEALTVLAPGGYLLCSTNSRAQSAAWLRDEIAEAAAQARRRFQITTTPSLPADFAADRDYAKTAIVRFP